MLVVEAARREDAGKVLALAHRNLSERYGEAWVRSRMEQEEAACFVARDIPSDEVVGFAVAEKDDAASAHLLALAVDGLHQGQGIGRALLRMVEDETARRGAYRIELDVRADDPHAQGFYQRNGFWPQGLRSHVYADGGDALHMARPVR